LRFKLHPIELEFKGKNSLLVDDSIVRGNTSKKIIELCREVGAKKVYFASAAPPIVSQDVYGIDMPTKDELIASGRTVEEVRKFIGADALFYGKVEDLHKSVRYGNRKIKRFSEGYFTGKYPTPEVTPELLKKLGQRRNETRSAFAQQSLLDEENEMGKTMTLV
jgi:amidophosphoribosyltransferase